MMRRLSPGPRDDGFTMVEILVSIAVIGTVMTALTAFFANSLSITNQQRGKQAAVQVVDDAMEKVRALKGSSLPSGRDKQSSDEQWNSPVTGVAPYLVDMQEAYDSSAVYPAGRTAALPTVPTPISVSGTTYNESWYIGQCWQAVIGGDCASSATPSFIKLYRVVVAITWSEKHCPNSQCSYVTSTLISGVAVEPLFNSNATAVAAVITNPGSQVGEVGSAITALQLLAAGGAAPLTWAATGLPTGLQMTSAGLVTGVPTVAGTFNVVLSTTDAFKLVGTSAFTWVINAKPDLTSPGNQTSAVGNAVSLPLPLTGGTAPYTFSAAPGLWGATGLPPGLSLNATTGLITGTPTTTGTHPVTINVLDSFLATDTVTFTWNVLARPTIASPTGTRANNQGDAVSVTPVASGGTLPYTWSATNLPTGLTLNAATGLISGTITAGSRFVTTLTCTDANGAAHAVDIVWTVANGTPRITAPTGDRTDAKGTAVSVPLTATNGASNTYTWTATGLPPGVTLGSGKLSGTPTTAGTYPVTVTAKDSSNKVATLMFTWIVS
jgi:prepilin-type N-terminal cleavage/methylation domain-containing protein